MNTDTLYKKIELGLQPIVGKTILHTAPHHDDILLGYFPYVIQNLQGNNHHALYITSGANGVSDAYLSSLIKDANQIDNRFIHQDIIALDSAAKKELKSSLRESESEKKWLLAADGRMQIKHLRAEFYNASDESMQSAMKKDIQRVVDYLMKIQPDIITILTDSMDIGHTTHHRSQRVMTAAILQWQAQVNPDGDEMKIPTIFGYRNVWTSFTLQEASMIIPVTAPQLHQVESIFMNCFFTQNKIFILDDQPRTLAQETIRIQKAQWQEVQELIIDLPAMVTKKTEGAIFLQKLTLQEMQHLIKDESNKL
ncbi:MAG: PIG-L family deacetylase [Candidatus Dependentiae bacterium]|nr:PIG-L family deacetylase [Candidatus Dependentiae bacterium]